MHPKHVMETPTICTLFILVLTESSNSSSNDHDDNTNYNKPGCRGADKSLAWPGRKQARATKLWLLQATQKKFKRLSVQPGLCSSNDLHVGRKMANFQLFFFCWVGLRTFQHPCISGFCRGVNEICALLGFYAAQSGSFLPTFQNNILVPSSKVKQPKKVVK